MNILSKEKQIQVVAALVEGNSISSTVRMTGVSKVTILKLLTTLGPACADHQDRAFRNLHVWTFEELPGVLPKPVAGPRRPYKRNPSV
jgi:hypothetical protein